MNFFGTKGDDSLDGGNHDDLFKMQKGGDDIVSGHGGNDVFVFGAAFSAADQINGGKGDDVLELNGDYSGEIVFGPHTITSIETIHVVAGHDYSFYFGLGSGTNGALKIDGSRLGDTNKLYVYAGGVSDPFVLVGGRGGDSLIGGDRKDMIAGGGGSDFLQGNGGNDIFVYHAVSNSTGMNNDTVVGYVPGQDTFRMPFAVMGVDPVISGGFLNGSSDAQFNFELTIAVNGSKLAASHAVLFQPDSGQWGGGSFLIVDANGVAGYQADADFVIHLGGRHLEQISVADFTT